jgi:hypothetical protein
MFAQQIVARVPDPQHELEQIRIRTNNDGSGSFLFDSEPQDAKFRIEQNADVNLATVSNKKQEDPGQDSFK